MAGKAQHHLLNNDPAEQEFGKIKRRLLVFDSHDVKVTRP